MAPDPDDVESQSVKVSVDSLMGIRVQPDETLDEAIERELDEEMTAERALEFFRDRLDFDYETLDEDGPW